MELSIVLVILGLLVGGVLGGRSLVKAAELRAIPIENQQWVTAVNTFRQKYFALPGDFADATKFWPSQTFNGDGSGGLPSDPFDESFLFWQHLALAGLITGEYTGEPGPAGIYHHVPGENCPASKYSGAGWAAIDISESVSAAAHPWAFTMDYHSMFVFGKQTNDNLALTTPTLTPEEAWNIDMKVDDGKPARGNMVTPLWDECTSAPNRTAFDADYDVSSNAMACYIGFRNSF